MKRSYDELALGMAIKDQAILPQNITDVEKKIHRSLD